MSASPSTSLRGLAACGHAACLSQDGAVGHVCGCGWRFGQRIAVLGDGSGTHRTAGQQGFFLDAMRECGLLPDEHGDILTAGIRYGNGFTTAFTTEWQNYQVEPIEQSEFLERHINNLCQDHTSSIGYDLSGFEPVPLATRLRVSYVQRPKVIPSLKDCAKAWGVPEEFLYVHPIGIWLYQEVKAGRLVVLCTWHTDAFASKGFSHPTKSVEGLTNWGASDMYAAILYGDLKRPDDWAAAKAGTLPGGVFKVKDGQTLAMMGAAGQMCAHIIAAKPGSLCVRWREFLVATQS